MKTDKVQTDLIVALQRHLQGSTSVGLEKSELWTDIFTNQV